MATGPNLQRRMVERYAVDELSIGWDVRQHGRLRRRTSSRPGEVVDVSVLGAAILAPADDRLAPRCTVVIDVDGDRGTVVVRNVRPALEPDMAVYGVEFVELGELVRARLVAPIELLRRRVRTVAHEWTGVRAD